METKTKKSKIILAIMIATVIVAAISVLLYLNKVNNYKKTIEALSFSNINISQIADGVYLGECDADMVAAKVEITITSGEIKNIKLLEHKQDRGDSAEAIIDTIIKEQQIDVDIIAGATNSSKVIKKAIENACLKGIK